MTKKPNGLRNVNYKLVEEAYPEKLESRGINSASEDLQVLANTLEVKLSESGEDRTDLRRQTSVSSFGMSR
jgi:hypothetical protein